FSSRRRHTRSDRDWSSDVCSSDLSRYSTGALPISISGSGWGCAMKVWHWTFLAQPHPLPEMLIGKAPVEYLDWKMASWTKAKDLSAFDPRALAHYRAFFSDPSRIHATCEDYRAGQTGDLAADEHDRAAGKKIACPKLALWGAAGIPSETAGPLKIWP